MRGRCRTSGDECAQPVAELGQALHYEGRAARQRLASGLQGVRDLRERDVGVRCGERIRDALRQFGELLRGARRQRHHFREGGGRGAGGTRRRLFEEEVQVRAARAERGKASESRRPVARRLRPRPGHRTIRQDEGRGAQIDRGVDRPVQRRRGDLVVLELQDHAREPGDRSGGLEVAHQRLDRPERAGAGRHGGTEGARQALDLDGVAERGAGAVRLHVPDRGRVDTCAADRLRHHLRLRGRARHGVTARPPAGVHGAGPDHAEYAVAVGQRVSQRA